MRQHNSSGIKTQGIMTRRILTAKLIMAREIMISQLRTVQNYEQVQNYSGAKL